MKRYSFQTAFALGALAVLWVAAAVASAHLLVLAMATVIAAVYGFGAWELRQYRADTQTLNQALSQIPADLPQLDDWLITLPASLQNPVRQRVEGERSGLPGPALTPYLVGLLVMLGMLGTFLGMVVTLNGAVFALEGSSSVAGIRAAFSEPIKGLGVAFGTSVAGVATSAMLGLMSSLARRERAQASQVLDTRIATRLRGFSFTHLRQEAYKALQQQSQMLPQLAQQLHTLMVHMADTSTQLSERLLAKQQSFHQEVQAAYTGLAQSVDHSLRTSLSQSMQMASDGMRPLVQNTMAQLAEQSQTMSRQLQDHTRQQLGELHAQFSASVTELAQNCSVTLAQQEAASIGMLERVGQTLSSVRQDFEQRGQTLLSQIQATHAEQQVRLASADEQRLNHWKAALEHMTSTLGEQWQMAGQHTLAQQQAICDTLSRTAHEMNTHTQNQAKQTLAEVTRLMASSEELVRARMASEAQWVAQHTQRTEELGAMLHTELSALRQSEDERGQAAVARLAELQSAVTVHLSTLGQALEEPINRLIETASEAPKAAAEVIGQLRQEISVSVARDNALLEERTRILETLSTLLDGIHHASTEQRGVIDALVSASTASLNQANERFSAHVSSESAKLGDIAAQVTASAVDVASLGENFGHAVQTFNASNEKLMASLQRIEQAMDKSMTRSDEQLAYYVAQAREIINLSITSQKDVLDTLQQRVAMATEGAV